MPVHIAELISQMTLEEKAGLCSGADFWHTKAVGRLGIPAMMVSDGPHGLRTQEEGKDINDSIKAVCFPAGCASAASFDVDLLRRLGETIGAEAKAVGLGVVLGPALNIKRSPLCGRNFEYYSEDPTLAGELSAAFINGVQKPGRGYLAQAFRGQQPGDPPHDLLVQHDRAHAARNLPARVRDRRQEGPPLDHHAQLQPHQRHLCGRKLRAADPHPARRMGL